MYHCSAFKTKTTQAGQQPRKNRSALISAFLFLLLLGAGQALSGQVAQAERQSNRQSYQQTGIQTSTDSSRLLTRRVFPFISLFDSNTALRQTLRQYKPLRNIAHAHKKALRQDLKKGQLAQALHGLAYSPTELTRIISALTELSDQDPALAAAIRQLKATGTYGQAASHPNSAFFRQVMENISRGVQHSISVYLFGQKPTYGKIDAISIDLQDPGVQQTLKDSLLRWSASEQADLFYTLPLNTALLALRLNGRTEAIWYEPLTGGMNAAPLAAIQNTDFSHYPYSVILVPGLGPEKPGVRLTQGGKQRCRMAAEQFNKKEAPFLIVSGGHVHPNKTPYCEAVEMKKYMVDSLHMDAAKILIEPYARHTTTNLRNATRLIKQVGIPFNQPVLIVTDKAQSTYINNGMRKTSLRDLGYTPYSQLQVLSPTLTRFEPAPTSLQVDPLDPLDP